MDYEEYDPLSTPSRRGDIEVPVASGEASRTLQNVNEILEEFKSAEKLQTLFELSVEKACSGLGFDRAYLFVEQNRQLRLVAHHDAADPIQARVSFSILRPYTLPIDSRTPEGESFRSNRPRIVSRISEIKTPIFYEFVSHARMSSYAISPVQGKGRMRGILVTDYYHRSREVSPADLTRMAWFTTALGFSIEMLQIIEQLDQKVQERTYALRKTNTQLKMMYEKARESDRLKSEFLANMSHELRTPLNSIIGFSKVILKGIDGEINERQRADLTAIHNNGVHLLGLINDILDLSKIEAGRMELIREETDVNELIDEAVETSLGLIRDKEVEIRVEVEENLPRLMVDKTRIRQVLLNLLSNAIKFTEKGAITINAAAGNDEVVIVVSDSGPGFPEEELSKLFDQFRQLDGAMNRKKGGSGLGLAISKRFVELHGGRIWGKSRMNHGSSFYFTLPIPAVPEEA